MLSLLMCLERTTSPILQGAVARAGPGFSGRET